MTSSPSIRMAGRRAADPHTAIRAIGLISRPRSTIPLWACSTETGLLTSLDIRADSGVLSLSPIPLRHELVGVARLDVAVRFLPLRQRRPFRPRIFVGDLRQEVRDH